MSFFSRRVGARASGLLIMLAAGCATTREAENVEDEGLPKREVGEVEIQGNEGVDDGTLTSGLANHPPEGLIFKDVAIYDPLSLELDKRRVESAYRENGYFSARVRGTEVVRIDEERVKVIFRVEEGPATVLEQIVVEGAPGGAPDLEAEALQEITELELGEPLEYSAYEGASDRIRVRLLAHGFAHAAVDGRVEVDRIVGKAVVRFRVDPGPIAVFGNFKVVGLKRNKETLIRYRIAWKKGERFDPFKIEETRTRIYQTGLVSSVRAEWPSTGRPKTVDITLYVSEGLRHEVRVGGGFGLDSRRYDIRSRATYSHLNFLDPKAVLRLTLRPSLGFFRSNNRYAGLSVEAGAELDREDFLGPRIKLTTGLRYALDQIEAFSYLGPSAKVSILRPFWRDRLVLAGSVQMHYYNFPDSDRQLVPIVERSIGLYEPLRFIYFDPSITIEGRDNPLNPHLGFYGKLRFELGHIFGEGTNYLKVAPDLRGYVPIFTSRLVFAVRVSLIASVLDGIIPVTQREYGGGADSQRGFGRRRLAPRRVTRYGGVVPVGGQAILESSAELRFEFVQLFGQWLTVAAFADAGDVTETVSEIDVAFLHWATGGGLRYQTPVGSLRFDIGHRLNRTGPLEPDPGSAWAYHLTLGEAF